MSLKSDRDVRNRPVGSEWVIIGTTSYNGHSTKEVIVDPREFQAKWDELAKTGELDDTLRSHANLYQVDTKLEFQHVRHLGHLTDHPVMAERVKKHNYSKRLNNLLEKKATLEESLAKVKHELSSLVHPS